MEEEKDGGGETDQRTAGERRERGEGLHPVIFSLSQAAILRTTSPMKGYS
jgi:hypothetical protein